MANNDMIQAKQVVDDLTASFEKHATQVKNAWDNLKDYSKGIAELPSEVKAMMTAINNDTQAVLKQNEVLKQSIILAKQKQAEAVKLATIEKQAEQVAQQKLRTSIQENNLKKSNISLSTAETNAENRATKQKEALLAKNEHLSRSYVKLKNELTQASNKLQDYTVSLGRGNAKTVQAQKEFDILSKKVGQADKAIGKLSSSNSAINALSGSVGNLMGAFGIGTGIFLAVDIAKGIYETTKEVQSLDTALKIVTKTEENFYDKQVMLNKLANDYGADINQLSKMFTQFYVSAKDKVSETEINRIFQGITKNANALGLTIQQQERGFLALNQMFSKTTVQSEELTGQLSEALPGAFKNMVQAYKNLHPEMKVTERSFREMMKDGKIMSSEILPEFIRVTDSAFGTENVKRLDNYANAEGRIKTAWINVVRAFQDGGSIIGDTLKNNMNILSTALNLMSEYLKSDATRRKESLANIRTAARNEGFDYIKSLDSASKQQSEANRITLKLEKENQETLSKINDLVLKNKQTKKDGTRQTPLGSVRTSESINEIKETQKEIAKLNNLISEKAGYIKGVNDAIFKGVQDQQVNEENEKKLKAKRAKEGRESDARAKKNDNEEEKRRNNEFLRKKSDLERLKEIYKDGLDDEKSSLQDKINFSNLIAVKEIEIAELVKEEEKRINEESNDLKAIADNDFLTDKENAISENAKRLLQIAKDNAEDIAKYYKENPPLFAYQESEEKPKGTKRKKRNLFEDGYRDQTTIAGVKTEGWDSGLMASQQSEYESMVEEYLAMEDKIANARKSENKDLEIDLEEQKDLLKKNLDDYKSYGQDVISYLGSFTEGFINDAGFSTLFDVINGDIAGIGDNWQTTSIAIMEVAQETMNFVTSLQRDNTEQQLADLDYRYQTALAMAGDSEAAQEEIKKQFEERRKQIKRQEVKQEREHAKFNIAINAAQGIVGAFKDGNPIKGAIFAGIIAAIALAQISAINNTPIPEYKDGTPIGGHTGGKAKINDASGNSYKEIVKTPDGKMKMYEGRNVVLDLPKGTEVFDAQKSLSMLSFNDSYDNLLMRNSINLTPVTNVNTNNKGIEDRLDKLSNAIKNTPTSVLNLSENGIEHYTVTTATKTKDLNNIIHVVRKRIS